MARGWSSSSQSKSPMLKAALTYRKYQADLFLQATELEYRHGRPLALLDVSISEPKEETTSGIEGWQDPRTPSAIIVFTIKHSFFQHCQTESGLWCFHLELEAPQILSSLILLLIESC